MELFIEIAAILMAIVGVLGCFLPILPGPPINWAALLILYFWGPEEITTRFMVIWLVITIFVTILDYFVPAYFTKVTGGSREAARGSLVGTMVGLFFFPPFGIIIGAFLGAMAAEMFFNRSNTETSFKSALGSFLGFIFGTFFKLMASFIMLYYTIKFIV